MLARLGRIGTPLRRGMMSIFIGRSSCELLNHANDREVVQPRQISVDRK